MKASEVLIKAFALIDTPEKWTKRAIARTSTGESLEGCTTATLMKRGVRFCAIGSLDVAAFGVDYTSEIADAHFLARCLLARAINADTEGSISHGRTITQWNDSEERTHEEVMEAFDKAIALAVGEP